MHCSYLNTATSDLVHVPFKDFGKHLHKENDKMKDKVVL